MASGLNDTLPEYYSYNRGIFEVRGAAGAGKTFQLTQDVTNIFKLRKKITVISFSNAAVNELSSRVGNTDVVLSTIHSFCWRLLAPVALKVLKILFSSGNFTIKSLDNNAIFDVKNVNYGAELGFGNFVKETQDLWLSHDDVIKIFTCALEQIPSFSKLITSSYDFILIDEYQDTKYEFLTALFKHISVNTVIGLYGDPYQSVYLDEHSTEFVSVENKFTVHKFILDSNYRSEKYLVDIFNIARSSYDGLAQKAVNDSEISKSRARVFIGNTRLSNKIVSTINDKMKFEKSTVLSNTNRLKTSVTDFSEIANQLNRGIHDTPRLEWPEILNTEQLNYRIKGLLKYGKLFFGSNYDRVVSLRSIFTDESISFLGMNQISDTINKIKDEKTNTFQHLIQQGLEVKSEYKNIESLLNNIEYQELANINDFYNNLENINGKSSTIYSSKGLEFDNVILNIDWGYHKGRNWNDINFYLKEGDESSNPNINLMSYLFYVGITRAKHGLAIYINANEHPNFLNSFQQKFSSIDIDYQYLI